MQKILIYDDEGANKFGVASLITALKLEQVDHNYEIACIDRAHFLRKDWHCHTHLLIFPGGRDIPYHEALKGQPNDRIREYVENGGQFLGICAGAYYGSSNIQFEAGSPLEVIAERELKFFPGLAFGSAYGKGKFDYRRDTGAQIAKLNLTISNASVPAASYFNGGCAFVEAEKHPSVSILARYADIDKQPAALIECQVGRGTAVLSGIHPEYSFYHECTKLHIKGPVLQALKEVEEERRALFKLILQQFKIDTETLLQYSCSSPQSLQTAST